MTETVPDDKDAAAFCADLVRSHDSARYAATIFVSADVRRALLALLLFGGPAIHSFTAVMMFGVVLVGTYTSIFIAAPILIYLGVGTHRADAQEAPAKKADAPAKREAPVKSR